MLAVHVVCADTEEEAARQLAPVHLMYRNLSIGRLHAPIPGADEAIRQLGGIPTIEKYIAGTLVPPKFVGGNPDSVREQLTILAKNFSVN
ncbi:MAG: MsnO8 family class oxidoreductase [Segetibacter sp.]|nr:MsnO8 family class oxidoreductase [Segetibacter sp.]